MGVKKTSDEVIVSTLVSKRAVTKHPGHEDQSVHNPSGGGGGTGSEAAKDMPKGTKGDIGGTDVAADLRGGSGGKTKSREDFYAVDTKTPKANVDYALRQGVSQGLLVRSGNNFSLNTNSERVRRMFPEVGRDG